NHRLPDQITHSDVRKTGLDRNKAAPPDVHGAEEGEGPMWAIIGWLVAIWIVLAVVGAVVKGLFWLAVIGGLLLAGTAAYGAIKSKR
ncbi:hypothetical protein, partial [Lentzea flava]